MIISPSTTGTPPRAQFGGALFSFSLCNLCVLCVSVVNNCSKNLPQRHRVSRSTHREFQIRSLATVQGIFLKAQLLTNHPGIGHNYQSVDRREIRILHYGHFRIAYVVEPDNNIDILGVFHGALNIERYRALPGVRSLLF